MIGQNFFTCVTFPKKLTQRRQFRQDYRFPFWGGEEKLKSETFRGYYRGEGGALCAAAETECPAQLNAPALPMQN